METRTERAAPAQAGSGSRNAQLGGTSSAENKSTDGTAQVVVGRIAKNSRETIRVALDEYKGHRYCDVRVFVPGTTDGDERPTKAGLTVKLAAIPELVELLRVAHAEAVARGLL